LARHRVSSGHLFTILQINIYGDLYTSISRLMTHGAACLPLDVQGPRQRTRKQSYNASSALEPSWAISRSVAPMSGVLSSILYWTWPVTCRRYRTSSVAGYRRTCVGYQMFCAVGHFLHTTNGTFLPKSTSCKRAYTRISA
jgi:hypothetical protein